MISPLSISSELFRWSSDDEYSTECREIGVSVHSRNVHSFWWTRFGCFLIVFVVFLAFVSLHAKTPACEHLEFGGPEHHNDGGLPYNFTHATEFSQALRLTVIVSTKQIKEQRFMWIFFSHDMIIAYESSRVPLSLFRFSSNVSLPWNMVCCESSNWKSVHGKFNRD